VLESIQERWPVGLRAEGMKFESLQRRRTIRSGVFHRNIGLGGTAENNTLCKVAWSAFLAVLFHQQESWMCFDVRSGCLAPHAA
jgi:hypothetical protein